jgi:hypothetical protein
MNQYELPIRITGGDTVLNKRVVEIGAWRNPGRQPQNNILSDLPDVPVMPGTLLLMEICANGPSIDLIEMTQLVLGDLGATIQILRRAGQEHSSVEERPSRIEDCISSLDVRTYIDSISRWTVAQDMNKPAILEAWAHAKQIAERCKLMAEEVSRNISPDEAYLIGLLHEIGTLPAILGWDPLLGLSSNPDIAGLRLAEAWSLPRCVVGYLHEICHPMPTNRWTEIVQHAHE